MSPRAWKSSTVAALLMWAAIGFLISSLWGR